MMTWPPRCATFASSKLPRVPSEASEREVGAVLVVVAVRPKRVEPEAPVPWEAAVVGWSVAKQGSVSFCRFALHDFFL